MVVMRAALVSHQGNHLKEGPQHRVAYCCSLEIWCPPILSRNAYRCWRARVCPTATLDGRIGDLDVTASGAAPTILIARSVSRVEGIDPASPGAVQRQRPWRFTLTTCR